jgi:septal ring factor EnvC (AmiA/AmiB activator)
MRNRLRDREAERAAIDAAIGRLLAGTPLRSRSGKLTTTELVVESGVRRDLLYTDHRDLVDAFQALAKAQNSTPAAMQQLAQENRQLKDKLAATAAELAQEQATTSALRKMVAELTLELDVAAAQLAQHANVTRLPTRDQHPL